MSNDKCDCGCGWHNHNKDGCTICGCKRKPHLTTATPAPTAVSYGEVFQAALEVCQSVVAWCEDHRFEDTAPKSMRPIYDAAKNVLALQAIPWKTRVTFMEIVATGCSVWSVGYAGAELYWLHPRSNTWVLRSAQIGTPTFATEAEARAAVDSCAPPPGVRV